MQLDIKNFTHAELRSWFLDHGEQAFRADQVFHWLYQKKILDFDDMRNVSKPLKAKLKEHFIISQLERCQVLRSEDGSIKYAFGLGDGHKVESVLMPHHDHNTICVSSQVGCAMGCDFCMTGKMGFIRNLTPGEIVSQILEAWKDLPEEEEGIRNVVFMGMGEPFHNYDNVIKTLDVLTKDVGFNYSHRRITVSTVGLLPQIQKFGQEQVKANLAVSLNGPTDDIRTRLMPVNKVYNLQKLVNTCKEYPLESRKRITFEYILMDGLTDSIQDAKQLIRLLHGLKFKINLIPYNETPGSVYKRPTTENVTRFQKYLHEHGVTATLRISKGQDIQGACGQLITQKKAKV